MDLFGFKKKKEILFLLSLINIYFHLTSILYPFLSGSVTDRDLQINPWFKTK